MSALQTSDLLPRFGEFTVQVAGRWVAAALAQAAALHEHDAWLYPADPAKQATAERLHDAWRCWADDAEDLLHRVKALGAPGRAIAGLDELRDAVGQIQAMLQLPPSVVARRREQMHRGELHSLEEVRRELRLGLRR